MLWQQHHHINHHRNGMTRGLQLPEDLSSQLEAAGCGWRWCLSLWEKKHRFRTDFGLQYDVARCISYIYVYMIDNYDSMLSQASLVQQMRLSNLIYFAAETWWYNAGGLARTLNSGTSPTTTATCIIFWFHLVPDFLPGSTAEKLRFQCRDRLTYQWRWCRWIIHLYLLTILYRLTPFFKSHWHPSTGCVAAMGKSLKGDPSKQRKGRR